MLFAGISGVSSSGCMHENVVQVRSFFLMKIFSSSLTLFCLVILIRLKIEIIRRTKRPEIQTTNEVQLAGSQIPCAINPHTTVHIAAMILILLNMLCYKVLDCCQQIKQY